MTNQPDILSCIEIEANEPAKFSIIWMHGLGADGNDFVPVASELKSRTHSDTRFVFPHAPVMPITVNNGFEMRAWYDIPTFSFTDIDYDGIAASVSHIKNLIEREIARGMKTENIFLAGFSQGAAMALTTGLGYPKPLAGIIALSGYLPSAEKVLENAAVCNQALPIFLAHGTEDPVLPYSLALNTDTFLKDAGYAVSFHSYDIPHSVCDEEIVDMDKWLASVKNLTQK